MTRFRNISIRKKILVSMLAFTLIPILLVSIVAITITYKTMRDQLIYDHRMSSGWLQDRLAVENSDMMDRFYEFEVDKDVKADILRWCTQDGSLDYSARWRIITVMNTVISMDSNINSIELFNMAENEVLIAERSGARVDESGERLTQWEQRGDALQSNQAFLRSGNEILACHQIHRFDDKQPIALVVFHLRPYHLEGILDEIKTVPEETILVFNDQNEVMVADYGTDWNMDTGLVEGIRRELAEGDRKEASYDDQFWFYRSVSGGKMQILLTIPNQTIVDALFPTVASSIFVAIIAVLASVVCSVVYSKAISRPIRDLSEEMKTITLNEYSGSTLESREDEIGMIDFIQDLYCSVMRYLEKQQQQRSRLNIDAVCRYIQGCYIHGVTLEQTADEFHVTKEYLSKAFKADRKEGFSEYVTSLRMKRAYELIVEFDTPLKDVGAMVGYFDLAHFYKTFKKHFGKTPGEVRESLKKDKTTTP